MPVPPPATPRWVGDTERARLTIPYLGTEPAPSRRTGTALQVGCSVLAVIHVVRAGMYLHLAAIDRDLLGHPTLGLADQARTWLDRLAVLSSVSLIVLVLIVVLELVWRSRRRPKQLRDQFGEAYVEFPLKWLTPVWAIVAWGAFVVVTVVVGRAGAVTLRTPTPQLPHHRQLAALADGLRACFWVSLIAAVVFVNRSHDHRLARSAAYRADPTQVPFFPPVRSRSQPS